jgi:hypothetical protein
MLYDKVLWIGLDWIGLDWIGLDWIGLDWMGWGDKDVLLRMAGWAAFASALAARRLGPWLKLAASLKLSPRLWLGRPVDSYCVSREALVVADVVGVGLGGNLIADYADVADLFLATARAT